MEVMKVMTKMLEPPATIELLSRGMECLVESLGIVDAELWCY